VGPLLGDFDNDGDIDLLIMTMGGRAYLTENEFQEWEITGSNWNWRASLESECYWRAGNRVDCIAEAEASLG